MDNVEFEKEEDAGFEETDSELAALEDEALDEEDDSEVEGINEPIPIGVPVYALFLGKPSGGTVFFIPLGSTPQT